MISSLVRLKSHDDRQHKAGLLKSMIELYHCYQRTPQWLTIAKAYWGWTKLKYPFLFLTRKGSKIRLHSLQDLVAVWSIFVKCDYRFKKNASTVIDIGARHGAFSIFACEQGAGVVHAVEPITASCGLMNNNIILNHLTSRVQIHNVQIAHSRRLESESTDEIPQAQTAVKTMGLCDFLNGLNLKKIDLLKLDANGIEHEIFQHCQVNALDKVKEIIVEYSSPEIKKKLFLTLQEKGFQLQNDQNSTSTTGIAHFLKV